MGYERYPRGNNPQGDYDDRADFGRDYGSGRDYSYSSARDYAAAARLGRDDDRPRDRDRYGARGGGGQSYYAPRPYGQDRSDTGRYGGSQGFYGQGRSGGDDRGSYAADGHRFEEVGRNRHADDDNRGQRQGGYGRQPQGYDYEDRGFLARAGDEVRSWFGDDDAERRREADSRYDERYDRGERVRSGHRDEDYHSWRSGQIAALDRDYDEYRRENRTRFENEFSTWRTTRQGQRDQLTKVKEHQEVVGSDGAHVGTVDKVRGDRILLTRTDADADGQHHSIPSSWVQSVDDTVTLSKTADDAKAAWRDEDRNQAMFGYGDNARRSDAQDRPDGFASGGNLNRSFSGTY